MCVEMTLITNSTAASLGASTAVRNNKLSLCLLCFFCIGKALGAQTNHALAQFNVRRITQDLFGSIDRVEDGMRVQKTNT